MEPALNKRLVSENFMLCEDLQLDLRPCFKVESPYLNPKPEALSKGGTYRRVQAGRTRS